MRQNSRMKIFVSNHLDLSAQLDPNVWTAKNMFLLHY